MSWSLNVYCVSMVFISASSCLMYKFCKKHLQCSKANRWTFLRREHIEIKSLRHYDNNFIYSCMRKRERWSFKEDMLCAYVNDVLLRHSSVKANRLTIFQLKSLNHHWIGLILFIEWIHKANRLSTNFERIHFPFRINCYFRPEFHIKHWNGLCSV